MAKRKISKRFERYLFRHQVTAIVLWRDGARAVVSVKCGDAWSRVLEADMAGNFHEQLDAEPLGWTIGARITVERDGPTFPRAKKVTA